MAKIKKISYIILCVFGLGLIFWTGCLTRVSADTDTSGEHDMGSSGLGGQNAYVGCLWTKKKEIIDSHTYMIDLVRRTKTQASNNAEYTIVASAIVGEKADSNKLGYDIANSNRRNIKKIKTSGEISGVNEITDLKTLAQYLNKHSDVEQIGTSLSSNAIWKMLKQLGLADYDSNTNKYSLTAKGASIMTIEQSPTLADDYGYRILIQKFYPYKENSCISAGETTYLLRKESARARYLTNDSGGAKEELKINRTNALGIKKYEKKNAFSDINALADKMNGAGYNIIWMNLDNVLETYKCEYIENKNQCKIMSQKSGESWKDRGIVSCNGQTEFGGHKLNPKCPKVTATCKETSTYGKCNIVTYRDGRQINTETVSCNEIKNGKATGKGKNTYKYYDTELTLETACPFKPTYNYDADVVCEDCESDIQDGSSYIIQDIVDWTAIVHSVERNDKKSTLQSYYQTEKDSGIFCRNEFNVVFPNQSTVKNVRIEAGKYFTVNEVGPTYINGVYNFEPIKVIRTRQCISKDANALNNYSNNTRKKLELGNVILNYKEQHLGTHLYDKPEKIVLKEDRTKLYDSTSSTVEADGNSYYLVTDTKEGYFKLEDGTYQYFENGTGKAEYKLNKDANFTNYTKAPTPTLPISMKNTPDNLPKDTDTAAKVSLLYNLPSDANLSKIKKYNELEEHPTEEGVYEKNNSNQTACHKMYKNTPDKLKECITARQTSDRGKDEVNACLGQIQEDSKFNYTCKIKSKKETDDEENCYEIAVNEGAQRKFICKDNSVCDEDVYSGKKYIEGKSCKKGEEPNTPPTNTPPCEIDCEAGFCCPDTTMVCPEKDENGMWTCPGKGNNTIIYRPIDLNNPFPGQDNYQRATGANWCSKKLDTGKIDCSNLNNQVQKHIRVNRGAGNKTVNPQQQGNESLYTSREPLYVVELDAKTIKDIRDYNKKTKYDDSNKLECKNGACKSKEFLRDKHLITSGKCNTNNWSALTFGNLADCAEDKEVIKRE